MPPETVEMMRLVLVKQLFEHGKSHRRHDNEIGNMLACHHYDLAVEMLLKIVGSKMGANITQEMHFWGIWNEVNIKYREKYNSDLPLKQEIKPLRDARNSVQHSGTIPSGQDLERFESYVETFLDQIIQTIFNIPFTEIKLSNLIKDEPLKRYVNDAENFIATGDYTHATERLSIAFAIGSRKITRQIYTDTWDHIIKPFGLRQMENVVGDRPVKELEDILKKIEEMLTFLGLGINYRDYVRFKQSSYHTTWIMGRDEPLTYIRTNYTPNLNDTKFNYDFVLNSFINWQL